VKEPFAQIGQRLPEQGFKLVQKILVGNYELYHGYFRENNYNVISTVCKCCSCCEFKKKFSEYLATITNMNASNGRLSGDGSAQVSRHGGAFGGSYPEIFFVPPKFCYAQNICFKHMIKIKIFPPKNVLSPPNLKTWLRA